MRQQTQLSQRWNRPGGFLSRYIQSVFISKAQAGPSGSQGGQKKLESSLKEILHNCDSLSCVWLFSGIFILGSPISIFMLLIPI